MLKLHAAGDGVDSFSSFVRAIDTHSDVDVIGTSATGAQTVEAMKSGNVDALIFPVERSDVVRTLKISASTNSHPPLVVVAEALMTPILARSLACGFDGAVSATSGSEVAVQRIRTVVDGTWHIENEPSLRGLGLTRGLLARELVFDDVDDHHVADLVGTGLPDEEIAIVMEWPIQKVRNHIERLLTSNGLAYRTQLAVIRASILKVPDFF